MDKAVLVSAVFSFGVFSVFMAIAVLVKLSKLQTKTAALLEGESMTMRHSTKCTEQVLAALVLVEKQLEQKTQPKQPRKTNGEFKRIPRTMSEAREMAEAEPIRKLEE